MKRYIYKRRDNGTRVESDKPLNDPELVLVRTIRDGSMKGSARVRTK